MAAASRPSRRWPHAVERVLMTIAMLALGWYAGVHAGAWLDHRDDVRAFERMRTHRVADAPPGLPAPAWRPSERAGDGRLEPGRSVRTAAVPSGLVGRIEVPRLGLSAIVREGSDARTLRRAVGHLSDTALPGSGGNVVLAGHRDTFFRPLKHVRHGDRIRVTTTEGTFDYSVRDARVVAPTDVSVLDPTPEDTLTLITCYPFNYIGTAPKRFVVQAVRTQN